MENNEVNIIYNQVEQFLKSNNYIYKYLNKDIREERLFFAVPRSYIKNWENYIEYDKICEKLKENGRQIIINEDENRIKPIIEKNVLNKSKLNLSTFNDSFLESLNSYQLYKKGYVSPDSDFLLFTLKEWNSFVGKEEKSNLIVRIGKKKIIIKFSNKELVVFTLDGVKNEINKFQFQNNLRRLLIIIEDGENDEKSNKKKDNKNLKEERNKIFDETCEKLIEKLIELDINELYSYFQEKSKEIYFSPNNSSFLEHSPNKNSSNSIPNSQYFKLKLEEIKASKQDIICSQTEIQYYSTYSLNESIQKDLIKLISKIEKIPTSIISVFYALCNIKDLTEYFNDLDKKFLHSSFTELFYQIKLFINNQNLVSSKEEKNKEILIKLLEALKKEYTNYKDFEIDPINFMKKILEYLNKELKGYDINIKNQLNQSIESVINEPTVLEFFKKNIEENNSIISSLFSGYYSEEFEKCQKFTKKYNQLQYIELNLLQYQQNKGRIYVELNKLIEYYFSENKITNDFKCEYCQQNIHTIKTKIYKFPKYLLIFLNSGEDSKTERNEIFYNNNIIDLSKFYFKSDNKKIEYKCNNIICLIKTKTLQTSESYVSYQYSYYNSLTDNKEKEKIIPKILFCEKVE